MEFETVRFHFLSDVLICCNPKILLQKWGNDFSSLLVNVLFLEF